MFPVGAALSQLLSLYNTLKHIPWLWRCLTNWSAIKKVLEDTRDFVESARLNGGLPKTEAISRLLESVSVLFEKEIVDFDDLDEKVFAETLREIEGNLVSAVDQGRRTVMLRKPDGGIA